MAKYTVTRACGHEETISLIGKTKLREWRLENVEPNKPCYECWQAEQARKREEENRQAAEAAQGQELPALVGTEKQILWAETLRQKFMADIEKIIDAIPEDKKDNSEAVLLVKAVDSIMAKTSASWFIENRFTATLYIVDQEMKLMQKLEKVSAEVISETDVAQVKIEATVRPQNPKTETVAEIRVLDDVVEVDFPEKREDFWTTVKKQLRMIWNGKCWRRELTPKSGTAMDRAAEIGHRLLAAGFPIRIYDSELREKVIAGDYEPEQTRWVMRRKDGAKYAGWFAISWGKDDDLYAAAKRIPGSRYDKPSVVVPPEQFEQVLDFAGRYGFAVSEMAQALADEARAAKEVMLVVIIEAKPKEAVTTGVKPPVLDVPQEVGVDESLRDTD
jgi:hypothetical protein